MSEIKRILVVNKMILNYQKVLHVGVSLAKKYGARLYIVHVYHNPFTTYEWDFQYPKDNSRRDLCSEIQERAKREFDTVVSLNKAQGVLIKEIVREDASADDVMQLVNEEKIDLMIMPAHQEGHLEHLMSHPDKHKILRQLPCSILLVKED